MTSRTAPSTPRLSEVARHVVVPEGIVTTAWPRVVAKCAELDVSFDEWQHGIGSISLGKRQDGKYAATVGGVVLSIPRQVGKTFLVGMIVIALCLLNPGLTVLWTAHRSRTATKTFGSLKGMTSRKKVKPFMLEPRNSNGEQEIRFRNGSVIMFGAREQGFGRGFDEVDIEVFDEAQILSEKALEDMVPAANQSRQAAGALLFFMGTPPRPTDPGEEFTNRRAKALSGKAKNMVYVEFSADNGAVLDDRKQWAKANPSFPRRTPVESIERMRENLTDDDSFRREGLGIWPEEGGWSGVIDRDAWLACAHPREIVTGPIVLAVETTLDRGTSSVVAVGSAGDAPRAKVLASRPGTGWVAATIAAAAKDQPDIQAVVLDGKAQAATLADDIEAALLAADVAVEVFLTNTSDLAQACALTLEHITTGALRHGSDPELDAAVRGAEQRPLGDNAWAWSRRKGGPTIAPLVAMSLALWKWLDLDRDPLSNIF